MGPILEKGKEVTLSVSIMAVDLTTQVLTRSIEIIKESGGHAYDRINSAIVEFVEADIDNNQLRISNETPNVVCNTEMVDHNESTSLGKENVDNSKLPMNLHNSEDKSKDVALIVSEA